MLSATVVEPEVLQILKELNLRSSLMVPLVGSKQVLGVITLILAESGRRYTEEDLGMAQELAHRASLAIENARLYEEAQQELRERKQAEKVILHQALHDALTGLPNRILLQDRLATGLTRAKRKNEEIAIIFLDLDRFKNINDTLGHQTGDKLLQQVAKRLSSAVRSQDTVARFGGDEFTILLTGLNPKKEIKKLADKIFTALQDPIMIDDHELHVNISMGIAIYPLHGRTEDVLLKNADIALYHAKDEGRNNYCIYDPGLTLKASERLQIEQELRNGLTRGEFHIHYQPVLDLKNSKIVGAEALLRWQHPKRGLLMPGDFIEHAEESGLILPLGEWAITHVCEQLARWHEQGLPPFKVALNFSTLQFSHTESFQKLHASIQKHHLHSSQLEIEITESIAMQSLETTIPRLEQIKKMGVRVAIDDFGIGHSSLSYLKLLPIDTIKIDKSFVECCTSDKYDAAIIQAIIAMARSLDIRVVAEGVETKEQLRFLKKSRCQEVQGHYISHALPEQEFIKFMQEYPGK
jgi:diguanylate cyclase (GGDEF)-like protein